MAPEQPTTIRILVEQILSNLQSFTKVPKSGTLSQYQLRLHLKRFFTFKKKNVAAFIYKIVTFAMLVFKVQPYLTMITIKLRLEYSV